MAHGVKRAREEQGQLESEAEKAENNKKKPKSFLREYSSSLSSWAQLTSL